VKSISFKNLLIDSLLTPIVESTYLICLPEAAFTLLMLFRPKTARASRSELFSMLTLLKFLQRVIVILQQKCVSEDVIFANR